MRRQLHAAEVARRDGVIEPPSEILVESLRPVDVGNAEQQISSFMSTGSPFVVAISPPTNFQPLLKSNSCYFRVLFSY